MCKATYLDQEDHVLPSAYCVKVGGGHTFLVMHLGETKNRDGNKRWNDFSCDSDLMKKVMPKVGKHI